MEILQNFVAFSEYMNFRMPFPTLDSRNSTIAKILFESKDLMVAVKPRNLFIDFLCSVAPKAVLQPEPGVLGDPCLMGMKSFQFHQSWFDV